MSAEVVKNEYAKTQWHCEIKMDKQLMVYQSEIVLVEEGWKRTAVTDVAITSYGGKRKKEHENLEKKQGVIVEEDVACEDISDPCGNQSNWCYNIQRRKGKQTIWEDFICSIYAFYIYVCILHHVINKKNYN